MMQKALIAAAFVAGLSLFACGDNDGPPAPAAAAQQSTATATVEPTPTAVELTPTPDRIVTLAAVGDVMLARDLTTLMDEHGFGYPYQRIWHLLREADIAVANLEVAFTERGVAEEKLYTFRTPPRFAAGLVVAGIDVVALGNNHTADFGPDGIADTIDALERYDIGYSGAGDDDTAAARPHIIEANGLRVAFLSYTDVLLNTFAGPDAPGVALATADGIAAGVTAAAETADVVVVSLHSGIEYVDEPTLEQRLFARAAIDAGALIVLGHHPHTLQGWERYGDGLIIYSLGNFVFDLDAEDLATLGPRAFETGVVTVTFSDEAVIDISVEPVFIDPVENRPRPATAAEAGAILQRIEALNEIAQGQ